MGAVKEKLVLDCESMSITAINQAIRKAAQDGVSQVEILNPLARHNLGVAITDPVHLVYKGDVGYYTVSLCDGVTALIEGNAGWAIGENLQSGEVVVTGNASTACAPSMRGGRVVVKGDVGPRTGIGMKGGELIVGGNVGYMTGFMMQKGRMIICGNTGRALGDSMYDGVIYVGGEIGEQGNGTKIEGASDEEYQELKALVEQYGIVAPPSFKKITCDGSLHNFNKKEFGVWKEIL